MMNRRVVLAGLAASPALLSAAPVRAGMAAASIEAPVEINFYNYNLATAGLGADATRKMLREFAELNPMIKVNGIGANAAGFIGRVQADLAARRQVRRAQPWSQGAGGSDPGG